jgi:two-component system, chemotaxis family, sensor kinase CheA
MTEVEQEFLDIFRDEANERLDSMVSTLLAVERGAAGPDAVDQLFRDAHTIKGGAGMLALDDVRELAHAVEDVLDSAREAGSLPPSLADPLLRAADALRRRVGGEAEPAADLLDELAASRVGDEPEPMPGDETSAASATLGAAGGRSIRVPAAKLDRLLDLVGESVLHHRRLEHDVGAVVELDESAQDELDLGRRLLGELQEAAIGLRTLPLAAIAGRFPRAVRDLAAAEGKDVELTVSGSETELDRVILEGLAEPLVHLLRNAVAHGIEGPGERARAGKPPTGRIDLCAAQRGHLVAVLVRDDGRGVSPELLERARREGSLADVLAGAGFSTAEEVSELSGRGVGLDAVKRHVESLGGSLEVGSEPGRGTTVTLLLPSTLALLDVLLVERSGQVFGVPLAAVDEAVLPERILALAGETAVDLRGASLPLHDLADLLGAPAPPLERLAPALVLSASGRRLAVRCDRLIGDEEVVVKPLGPLLEGTPGYLGAAVLGDGSVALLLDPAHLVRSRQRVSAARPPAADEQAAPTVLVVEDSLMVRELQRGILAAAGYRVVTARDGRDALEKIRANAAIELVVTDLEMPELDGLGLTRAIRADPAKSALPVVVVTSRGDEDDRRRGIEAGADTYIVKSAYDQQALLDAVRRLLGR